MNVDTFVTSLIVAIVIGTISGFGTGVVSEQLLGRARAHQYLIGSLVAGFFAGLLSLIVFPGEVASAIVGLAYGVVGWLLYRHFFPVRV